MKELRIIIDNLTVNRYNAEYFLMYPRRKKAPIDSPIHPSLNKWTHMPHEMQNDFKQKWNDFTLWVVKDLKLDGMLINKCKIIVTNYFGNKRVRDLDNVTIKFFQDAFVQSGLLVKDDYHHVEELVLRGGYDKDHCRTEILFIYDYEND